MKKLMIAAAIVCAAAFAQAANFSWGLANYEQIGPTADYLDEYGYLKDANVYLYIGETLVAGPANRDDAWTYGAFNNDAVDTTGKVQTLGTGDISETFKGQAYKIVVETLDGKYFAEIEGVSQYATVTQAYPNPSLNFETFVSEKGLTAGDWQSVPEPTSGLLLLLGVAGLALRRRRA